MEPLFIQGQSDNLPRVDSLMVAEFFSSSSDFSIAEIRGVKEVRSARVTYGDNAIGYVQLKREGYLCTVRCRICPEHKVRNKNYTVIMVVDENAEKVISVQCLDCPASLGGCKHAVAFLMWAHRRSEEPARTSITCYWKKSKLSGVGMNAQSLQSKDFGAISLAPPTSYDFLNDVLAKASTQSSSIQIVKQFTNVQSPRTIGLHNLMINFVQDGGSDCDMFMQFASSKMTQQVCDEVNQQTVLQSDSPLWHDMRYGRITASKAYTAMHCKTAGTFVEQVIGITKLRDTVAMARGRKLERSVLEVVQRQKNMKFLNSGIILSSNHPIIGASPDGTTDIVLIEIKCPFSEKNISNYLTRDNKLTAKCKAQVQVQLLMCQKNKCFFCIADPNFEQNKVTVVEELFDKVLAEDIVSKCEAFWKKEIFPILFKCSQTIKD